MQCPSCRREVSGTFCNFCGATLAAAAPAGSVPPPPPTAAPGAATSSGLSDNAAAAIAYLTIIPSIIFLLIDPYKRIPLVRFHSFQNIALAVVCFVAYIAWMIADMVLLFVPFMHFLVLTLGSLVYLVIALGTFIAWLLCIIKASQGQFFKLPFIGDFAAKQANV